MGKTVPSFLMALEFEIADWKSFRNSLQSDEDKQAFDALMDICRNNAMAAGNACNPIIFEPMVMSILLGQKLKFRELDYKPNEVIWQKTCSQRNSPKVSDNPQSIFLNQANKQL